MAQLFTMPQPGSTMEEGTILKWLRAEGETIRRGEPLLEIETDKATLEVEATEDGVIRKILAVAGAVVPVRQGIAIIAGAEESIEDLLREAGLAPPIEAAIEDPVQLAPEAPFVASGGEDGKENGSAAPISPSVLSTASMPGLAGVGRSVANHDGPTRVDISPRARRAADTAGVAIAQLAGRGSGPQGRVIERDVMEFLQMRPAPADSVGTARPTSVVAVAPAPPIADPTPVKTGPRATPLAARMADELGVNLTELTTGLPGSRVRSEDVMRQADRARGQSDETSSPLPPAQISASPAMTSPVSPDADAGYTTTPLAGMRKRIAENVAASAFSAPHVTLTLEVDMAAAAEFRARLLPEIEKAYGARVSYTEIIVKAAARALDDFPLLNSALVNNEVRTFAAKNIGVAVALDEGLIVPVVKNAERTTLGAISAELKQLAARARAGKFTPDDLSGGTFSITNLGAFEIDIFDPIIVSGQAAILGVARIADKPVAVNGEVVIRPMMNLCLSFDHRILDGVPAARFLQRLKELLEAPLLILV